MLFVNWKWATANHMGAVITVIRLNRGAPLVDWRNGDFILLPSFLNEIIFVFDLPSIAWLAQNVFGIFVMFLVVFQHFKADIF